MNPTDCSTSQNFMSVLLLNAINGGSGNGVSTMSAGGSDNTTNMLMIAWMLTQDAERQRLLYQHEAAFHRMPYGPGWGYDASTDAQRANFPG
jgi:hypothetical protein